MSAHAKRLGHRPRTKGVNEPYNSELSFEQLRARMRAFAKERDWDQFHSPRNIMLAMTGEVGELAELFQWKGDAGCQPGLAGWSDDQVMHLGQEMSDVLLYLLRLSDRCGIDLPLAALDKMQLNAAKYPADRARGRSDKYEAYTTARALSKITAEQDKQAQAQAQAQAASGGDGAATATNAQSDARAGAGAATSAGTEVDGGGAGASCQASCPGGRAKGVVPVNVAVAAGAGFVAGVAVMAATAAVLGIRLARS